MVSCCRQNQIPQINHSPHNEGFLLIIRSVVELIYSVKNRKKTMARHKFTSENQPKDRKPRAEGRRTLLLKAIKEQSGKTEDEFYKSVVERAMNPEDPASSMLMKEVLSRLYPSSKPTMPIVEFKFPSKATPVEKVDALEKAIASGDIPADVAKIMVEIIKAGMEIENITDIKERVEAIEKALNNAKSE